MQINLWVIGFILWCGMAVNKILWNSRGSGSRKGSRTTRSVLTCFAISKINWSGLRQEPGRSCPSSRSEPGMDYEGYEWVKKI